MQVVGEGDLKGVGAAQEGKRYCVPLQCVLLSRMPHSVPWLQAQLQSDGTN